jgi:hypothetical protein
MLGPPNLVNNKNIIIILVSIQNFKSLMIGSLKNRSFDAKMLN